MKYETNILVHIFHYFIISFFVFGVLIFLQNDISLIEKILSFFCFEIFGMVGFLETPLNIKLSNYYIYLNYSFGIRIRYHWKDIKVIYDLNFFLSRQFYIITKNFIFFIANYEMLNYSNFVKEFKRLKNNSVT